MIAPGSRTGSRHIAAVLIILAGYAALAFHTLGGPVLWNDEAFSYFIANGGAREALLRIAADTQPPFYYLVLSQWLSLGHGPAAIRSLSAAAGVVAVLFVYLSARPLLGRNGALLAMLLFGIAPDSLLWAQKARPYGLQTMLVAIALWGFIHILLDSQSRERPIGSGLVAALRGDMQSSLRCDLAWLAYAVGGGLAMLAQHPAGFFVFGCNVVMALVMLRDRGGSRLLFMNWVVAQLLLVAIWATWLLEFIDQVRDHLTPDAIRSKHAIFLVPNVWPPFIEFFGVAHLWRLQPAPVLFYGAALAFGLVAAIRQRSSVLWIYLLVASPVVLCILAFYLVHPVFGYVIFVLHWLMVPYAILVAHGITAIRPRPVAWAVVLVLVVLNSRGLFNYYDETSVRLDLIASLIADDAKPDDAMVFGPQHAARVGLAYYYPYQSAATPAGLHGTVLSPRLIETREDAAPYRRIWVVVPTGSAPMIGFDVLADFGRLAVDRTFGTLIVRRYDRVD
ncbi:MAG: glycosyltransferase family 39 protein [Acetobacteraceae bacterium]